MQLGGQKVPSDARGRDQDSNAGRPSKICCCSLSGARQAAAWRDQPCQKQVAAVISLLLHMGSTHCRQLTASQEQTMQVCALPASLLVQLATTQQAL